MTSLYLMNNSKMFPKAGTTYLYICKTVLMQIYFDNLIFRYFVIYPSPAEPGYILPLQTVEIQNSWLLKKSALFAIKYVNLYQQSGSSNLTGLKLEVGVAS